MRGLPPQAGPPGSILQEARLQAGKSLDETADALNLLKTFVQALEDNDYSRFNSPLFARGYIKSYARYMQLDEAPLLRDCDRICRREEEATVAHAPKGCARAPGHARVILALLSAVLIFVAASLLLDGESSRDLDVSKLDKHPELARIVLPASLGDSLLSAELGLAPAPEDQPSQPSQGVSKLELLVFEDVWLELRDSVGEIISSGVQTRGSEQRYSVTGPVTLSIAYWPAVSLHYNGQPVDLRPLADSNVLRVKVGER